MSLTQMTGNYFKRRNQADANARAAEKHQWAKEEAAAYRAKVQQDAALIDPFKNQLALDNWRGAYNKTNEKNYEELEQAWKTLQGQHARDVADNALTKYLLGTLSAADFNSKIQNNEGLKTLLNSRKVTAIAAIDFAKDKGLLREAGFFDKYDVDGNEEISEAEAKAIDRLYLKVIGSDGTSYINSLVDVMGMTGALSRMTELEREEVLANIEEAQAIIAGTYKSPTPKEKEHKNKRKLINTVHNMTKGGTAPLNRDQFNEVNLLYQNSGVKLEDIFTNAQIQNIDALASLGHAMEGTINLENEDTGVIDNFQHWFKEVTGLDKDVDNTMARAAYYVLRNTAQFELGGKNLTANEIKATEAQIGNLNTSKREVLLAKIYQTYENKVHRFRQMQKGPDSSLKEIATFEQEEELVRVLNIAKRALVNAHLSKKTIGANTIGDDGTVPNTFSYDGVNGEEGKKLMDTHMQNILTAAEHKSLLSVLKTFDKDPTNFTASVPAGTITVPPGTNDNTKAKENAQNKVKGMFAPLKVINYED